MLNYIGSGQTSTVFFSKIPEWRWTANKSEESRSQSPCWAVPGWAPLPLCWPKWAWPSANRMLVSPWLWVSRAWPRVSEGCPLLERTWPPLPLADLNLTPGAPPPGSEACLGPLTSVSSPSCSLSQNILSPPHWPGSLLLRHQASGQRALFKETFVSRLSELLLHSCPLQH